MFVCMFVSVCVCVSQTHSDYIESICTDQDIYSSRPLNVMEMRKELKLMRWLLCLHSCLTVEPIVDRATGPGESSGVTPTQGPTLSGLFAGGFPVLRPVGQRDRDSHDRPGAWSYPGPIPVHCWVT